MNRRIKTALRSKYNFRANKKLRLVWSKLCVWFMHNRSIKIKEIFVGWGCVCYCVVCVSIKITRRMPGHTRYSEEHIVVERGHIR